MTGIDDDDDVDECDDDDDDVDGDSMKALHVMYKCVGIYFV